MAGAASIPRRAPAAYPAGKLNRLENPEESPLYRGSRANPDTRPCVSFAA
jgi:hypothetical protein